VDRIGPAGHFAGSSAVAIKTISYSWICYGLPDGSYTKIVTSHYSPHGAHGWVSRIVRIRAANAFGSSSPSQDAVIDVG
jgi:hypothetical protein